MLLQWLGDNAWAVWLILAGGLAVSEMLTLDLTLLMLATGALAGAITAFFLPGLLAVQVLVAIVVALTMLFVTRPALLKRLHNSPGYQSSMAHVLGASGTAVGEITASTGEPRTAVAAEPTAMIGVIGSDSSARTALTNCQAVFGAAAAASSRRRTSDCGCGRIDRTCSSSECFARK